MTAAATDALVQVVENDGKFDVNRVAFAAASAAAVAGSAECGHQLTVKIPALQQRVYNKVNQELLEGARSVEGNVMDRQTQEEAFKRKGSVIYN